jgi:uncharacterized membrane protein YjfL (UPF0719 family)
MKEQFLYILVFLYGLGGIVTFVGFVPTMIDLWNKKPSANITTYVIWTATTFVISLYGFFIFNNLVFNIVINFQLLACLTVLILRIRLKYKSVKK